MRETTNEITMVKTVLDLGSSVAGTSRLATWEPLLLIPEEYLVYCNEL